MDYAAYSAFLKKRAKDFRNITAKTNGELEPEDLHSEAWLFADYLAEKRGEPIDWKNEDDQGLILATLTVKHVWRKAEERELTISADETQENEDGESNSLLALFRAEETADPLELLERREDEKAKPQRSNWQTRRPFWKAILSPLCEYQGSQLVWLF